MNFHRKYGPLMVLMHLFGFMAGLVSLTGMPPIMVAFSFSLAPVCHLGLWCFHDHIWKD